MSRSPRSSGARVIANKWVKVAGAALLALVVLLVLVLVAKWMRGLPAVQSFMVDYPGHSELPPEAPVGIPSWLGWQHFLNMFFLVLIIRSGWLVHSTARPSAHWTRNNSRLIRTRNSPKKISLDLWFHLTLDGFWVANGVVFYILLFSTGQWLRLVPTRWDVFPNAVSTGIQYLSLNWPTDDGWVNYNSLQVLAYFVTVFVAAPLAILTGLRMSGAWPKGSVRLNSIYPIELARAIHFPVMLYFVLFVIVHVTLVLATGALRNLNHMYATQDNGGWTGFWYFAASLVVIVVAWVAARPVLLRPVASLMGKVSR